MRVRALLHGFPEKERELDLPESATADDLCRAMGIAPEIVVVMREGLPIASDEPLAEGETLRVLRVVTGGAR